MKPEDLIILHQTCRAGDADKADAMIAALGSETSAHNTLALALVATYRRDDPAQIVEALEENIDLDALDEGSQAIAHLVFGILRNRLGLPVQALDAFQEAEDIAKPLDWHEIHVDLNLERGVMFSWMGQFDAALGAQLKALSLAMDADCGTGQRTAWASIGRLYLEIQNYDQAEYYLAHALKGFGEEEDIREKRRLSKDFGEIYLGLRQYDKALETIDQLIAESSDRLDDYLRFSLEVIKIQIFSRTGDPAAGKIALAAAEKYIVPGDRWQEAILALALGEALMNTDTTYAKSQLELAEKYFRANGLTVPLWKTLNQFTSLLHHEGDLAAAEATARAARKIATDNDLRILLETTEKLCEDLDLNHGLDLRDGVAISSDYHGAKQGYVLLEIIGRGGYGDVYRAYDVLAQKEIALKSFHFGSSSVENKHESLVDTIKRELIVAARLNHPNIVTPLSFGRQQDNNPYVTMPYIEGRSLRAHLGERPTPQQISSVMVPVCSALQHAHSVGIIHRDLKPENILISNSGVPFIVDFGTAGIIGADTDLAAKSGTMPYMPPEQLRGHEPTPAMDSYALGVILHEWLVGERPAKDRCPNARIQYLIHLRKVISALKQRSINPEYTALIRLALSYSPAKRPDMPTFMASVQSAER